MAERGTDDGPETEVSGDEDDTTATEPVVDGIREPAADEGTSNVRTGVDQTDQLDKKLANRLVLGTTREKMKGKLESTYKSITRRISTDAVNFGEEDVSTIATSLIPALDRSTDRASRDSEEQASGHAPPVQDLVAETLLLDLVERLLAVQVLVVVRVLGDQGALAQERDVLDQVLLVREVLDIAH